MSELDVHVNWFQRPPLGELYVLVEKCSVRSLAAM